METINRHFYICNEEIDFETFMAKIEEFFEEETAKNINDLLVNNNFALRVKDIVVKNGKIDRVEE